MGGFGVEVVAEQAGVGPLEGTGVGYGEVHATFAAGVQVGAYLRQTLLLQPSRKSLPLLGLHTLGVAQCLEALEMVAWLYALHVVVPLPTSDRPAGVEEPAGAQHDVEVGEGGKEKRDEQHPVGRSTAAQAVAYTHGPRARRRRANPRTTHTRPPKARVVCGQVSPRRDAL